jgi:hypothetical protein
VSVLGVSEVRWKGQGELRSGDYTVYYSGVERAERGVAIVVHTSVTFQVFLICCPKHPRFSTIQSHALLFTNRSL